MLPKHPFQQHFQVQHISATFPGSAHFSNVSKVQHISATFLGSAHFSNISKVQPFPGSAHFSKAYFSKVLVLVLGMNGCNTCIIFLFNNF